MRFLIVSLALLLPAGTLAAELECESAKVLADGRIVRLTFAVASPQAYGFPDYRPGGAEGLKVNTDPPIACEFVGLWTETTTGRPLRWVVCYLSARPIVRGEAANVTLPAGLIRDDAGNTSAAFDGALINGSQVGADGFTSKDFLSSLTLYVSSSHGKRNGSWQADLKAGQNPATPLTSINDANNVLRNAGLGNAGCTVRLLRGDTFALPYGLQAAGPDAGHPAILEDYWDASFGADPGTRPIVPGLGVQPGRGAGNVIVRRLHVRRPDATPFQGAGIILGQPGSNITLDDCVIERFGVGIRALPAPSTKDTLTRIDGLTLLRCVIRDIADPGSNHSEGFYADHIDNLIVSQCTFDYCGRKSADLAAADIYSHALYLQYTCGPQIVWGNFVRQGGSHGIQQRAGGVMAYNVLSGNGLSAFLGGGTIYRNVAEKARDISPTLARGWGFETLYQNQQTAGGILVEGNIVANAVGHGADGYRLHAGAVMLGRLTLRNNTAVNSGQGLSLLVENAPAGRYASSRNLFAPPPAREVLWLKLAAPIAGAWYSSAGNAYLTPAAAQVKVNGALTGLAKWTAANGTEGGTVLSVPRFVNPTADLGGFVTSLGLGVTEDDYVAIQRNRMPGLWADAFDLTRAWRFYADAYAPTNLPSLGDGPWDFYGASDYRKALAAAQKRPAVPASPRFVEFDPIQESPVRGFRIGAMAKWPAQ